MPSEHNDFATQAQQRQPGLLREFFGLLRHNKKWWLMPIVVVLTLLGVLVILAGTSAAPLIYSTW